MAPAPEMTRRSFHMVIFRIDPDSLAVSRDRLIEAFNAEGIPASAGWYRPLYKNAVFQQAHEGPMHGVRSPLANKQVDYRDVTCDVCESVCSDAVWIPQYVLLGDEQQIEKLCDGLRHVITNADQIPA